MSDLKRLRFPIGEFSPKDSYTAEDINNNINTIGNFPAKLAAEVENLTDRQLDTPYRTGGWSGRQVVHHVADSHMNSYIRFKLTLTEETPAIRPYYEDRWAELPEAKSAPVNLSLPLLDALHKRWVVMLKNIQPEQMHRKFHHPESGKNITLAELTHFYAWHCEHHLAHITELKKRMGW
jgi:hypothetical protein